MPKKIIPKKCACGCGRMTKGGTFRPGHDLKTVSAIITHFGGIPALREFVEKKTRKPIVVDLDGLR